MKVKITIFNINQFSNQNNKKFLLLLQKGVYPYEYINDWEKFNEISLYEKEDFYSDLNMEDITDADYTHDPDPVKFYSAPGLVWQAAFKKSKVKLDLLTDNGMLLMVEKSIRGGISHSIYQYAKTNNKYMKDYLFIIGM